MEEEDRVTTVNRKGEDIIELNLLGGHNSKIGMATLKGTEPKPKVIKRGSQSIKREILRILSKNGVFCSKSSLIY